MWLRRTESSTSPAAGIPEKIPKKSINTTGQHSFPARSSLGTRCVPHNATSPRQFNSPDFSEAASSPPCAEQQRRRESSTDCINRLFMPRRLLQPQLRAHKRRGREVERARDDAELMARLLMPRVLPCARALVINGGLEGHGKRRWEAIGAIMRAFIYLRARAPARDL